MDGRALRGQWEWDSGVFRAIMLLLTWGTAYARSTWQSSVTAIPTAGPFTAATASLGKSFSARMNSAAGELAICTPGAVGVFVWDDGGVRGY